MVTIACPICAGPVELSTGKPSCLIGHEFGADELQAKMEDETSRALWSAVRALEDSASGARWRLSLPHPPRTLGATIALAEQQALVLRDLIENREGGTSDSTHRPEEW